MKMGDFVLQVVLLASLIVGAELVDEPFPGDIEYWYDGVDICPTDMECQFFEYAHLKDTCMFPDRFMTKQTYAHTYNLPYHGEPLRKKRSISSLSDNDRCCETLRYFQKAPRSVKVDTANTTCYIIHCAGINEYQFVPVGNCSTANKGSCSGKCVPQESVHSVVCFTMTYTGFFTFDVQFRIGYAKTNHYCSCKKI